MNTPVFISISQVRFPGSRPQPPGGVVGHLDGRIDDAAVVPPVLLDGQQEQAVGHVVKRFFTMVVLLFLVSALASPA